MKALYKLKEPSTLRGIISLVALVGWQLDVAQQDQIIATVISLFALVEVFRKEDK